MTLINGYGGPLISVLGNKQTTFKEDIMSIEQIAREALRLSPSDRAMLAETIWESLEDPYLFSSDISEEEAIVLAKQRDEAIERGDVTPLSHEELMARLRK